MTRRQRRGRRLWLRIALGAQRRGVRLGPRGFAAGGIVRRPGLTLVGERGPEQILTANFWPTGTAGI